MWGCFYDLPHALEEAWFCELQIICVMFGMLGTFQRVHKCEGRGSCWSFKEVGCTLLGAVVKE